MKLFEKAFLSTLGKPKFPEYKLIRNELGDFMLIHRDDPNHFIARYDADEEDKAQQDLYDFQTGQKTDVDYFKKVVRPKI